MLIDAHQHFWKIGANAQTWPGPDLAAIHRDFLPEDLWAVGDAVGLDGTIAVQSQPADRDTDWLLKLAAADNRILGVVGWVDLQAPASPARIADLARSAKFKGLRPMLQDLQTDWILRPELEPAIEAMIEHGLVFDALVRSRHLFALATFARRHPDLKIVLDHGGKPDVASGALKDWTSSLEELARLPSVVCKLSGLLTERAPGQSPDAVRPYAEHLFQLFGAERLIWGSDWPVLTLSSSYGEWLDLARDLCPIAHQPAVFGGVASRVYGLKA